jgi:DNA modification methylase
VDKNTNKIAIACTGAKNMQVDQFKAMQGELKTISPDNLDKLKKRILKYGFDAPIFVWGNYILDGHQRLVAIQSLIDEGYQLPKSELPVCEIKAKNMADAKKRLLGYISQFGHITAEGLDIFVEGLELSEISQEIDLPGFVLDSGIGDNPEGPKDVAPRMDEAEELQQKWLVNKGDLWECGKHRILCGDSTLPDAFDLLMGDQMAAMVLTDPPYNVGYVGKGKDKLDFDNETQDDAGFHAFLLAAFTNMCQKTHPGASFYVFHSDIQVVNFRTALVESGFLVKQGLVWNKSQLIPGRQDYQWKHEPILYGWREGAAHYWAADRKQTTVLEFSKPTVNSKHPTMKPVDLLVYLLKNSSKKGSIVLDPFLGSGSSMVACDDTDRICYGIELSPKYVAVTLQRYLDLTGNEPRRLNVN